MSTNGEVLRLGKVARERLRQVSDDHTLTLTRAWVEAWEEIDADLQDTLAVIMAGAKDGRVAYTAVDRSERLKDALELATERANALADLVGDTVEPDLPGVVRDAAESQRAMIQAQMPPGVPLAVEPVGTTVLDAIVARTTERIHSLSQPLSSAMVNAMKGELVRAIAVGANPSVTARRIIRRAEGKFNGGLSRALNLAHTETIDAHRAADMASDKAHWAVLDSWQWSAALDARTCVSCISQHGSRHGIDEPGPLDHQQGRCARIPITKSWADLGFTNVTEPPSSMPDAREWFEGLTEDTQQRIMGKARLQAFNDGQVSWDDLSTRKSTDGWRDSYHVTPLKDLGLR